MRIPEELRAYMVSLIMIFAVCSVALYEDSGGGVPECKVLSGTVIEKVYPIPDAPTTLHGFVVLVEDQVNETYDGKYYIVVSNATYHDYDVNYTFSQLICSAEEYETVKMMLFFLMENDLLQSIRANGEDWLQIG